MGEALGSIAGQSIGYHVAQLALHTGAYIMYSLQNRHRKNLSKIISEIKRDSCTTFKSFSQSGTGLTTLQNLPNQPLKFIMTQFLLRRITC